VGWGRAVEEDVIEEGLLVVVGDFGGDDALMEVS